MTVKLLSESMGETITDDDQVRIDVIHAAVGGITTNDVLLASASGAIVVGFNGGAHSNYMEISGLQLGYENGDYFIVYKSLLGGSND